MSTHAIFLEEGKKKGGEKTNFKNLVSKVEKRAKGVSR